MDLFIGNRIFSTWSLRPWLVLKRCGVPFRTTELDIYSPEGLAAMKLLSPSGFVPFLQVDGEVIWDSLAIAEWCAEQFPAANLWPQDPVARALARAATCEMHGGFAALRHHCATGRGHTMVGPDRSDPPTDPAALKDIARVVALWRDLRERATGSGAYLLGDWSIADAFFTPVAARLRHYQVDLAAAGDEDGVAAAYRDTLLAQPDFLEWTEIALR